MMRKYTIVTNMYNLCTYRYLGIAATLFIMLAL